MSEILSERRLLRLSPQAMALGGDAVARDDEGRVVFVEGALPAEKVEAATYEEHGSYLKASVLEVLEASPERVAPPCPHVKRGCGGCGWQHIAPAAQVRFKMALVTEALERLGGLREPAVRAGPGLPSTSYRTSLRVAMGEGVPGFRRRRSHELVEVRSCVVAHPLLAELLAAADFGQGEEAVLRCGARTGERLCVLKPCAAGADMRGLAAMVGEDELRSGRRAWIFEQVAGARLRVSAKSFFQARADGAEVLVGLVGEALFGAPSGPLVDAYGGTGLFAATLGRERPVVVLENNSSAAADARANVPGAVVVQTDVARWRPERAVAVVADPPRSGLGRRATTVLSATRASHFALVSCDPASLARDARLLAGEGFRHISTTVVDMFPGTPHVETVSTFTR
ncbi:MAG TPA: hypothetical protein VME20_04240 [Acidimicrobiales bacterium]|nr:hypothetical protein [Acidimicrobiales bacterium]